MKPFVVNRYGGRMVFPFNFFPELAVGGYAVMWVDPASVA